MQQQDISIFFALLRSAVGGEPLSQAELAACSPERLPALIKLAKLHDLEHLLALGLRQNHQQPEAAKALKKGMFLAVLRQQRQEDALKSLCDALEAGKIPFIPLKGSVLRQYYPEPWMRTSCDIDILVKQEDAQRAAALLEERCGCIRQGTGSHDISLFTPNKTHLELHYTLHEEIQALPVNSVLATVWDRVTLRQGSSFHYEMPDDLFYFYHIAHMAKHITIGGCGIRPFLDLWIMDCSGIGNGDALLHQGGLLRFSRVARALCGVWFENAAPDPATQQLEDYILRGGVYGSSENHIAVQQQKQGGRLRYLLSKIFLPFDTIKYHYPVLQKHPWLMPVMQVRRWCKLLFCGHALRVTRQVAYGWQITGEAEEKTKIFLKNIGL